jgi:hypothetical protein
LVCDLADRGGRAVTYRIVDTALSATARSRVFGRGRFGYHLANGIRHWSSTLALASPADADASAWFAILFAIAAPIGLWALITFGA